MSRNPTNSIYPHGSVVTLTANPSNAWMFSSWSGDATGTANPLNLLMDSDKVVMATFSPVPVYHLAVGTSGQGSVSPASGDFLSNSVVTLTATPAEGWLFGHWTGSASSDANPLTLTMNADISVSALFGQPPLITSQPQSTGAEAGQTALFQVGAQGSAPLAFAWQKDGLELTATGDATLTLSNVQIADAGAYRVRVSNDFGSVLSDAAALAILGTCTGSNVVTACTEPALRAAVARGGHVRLCCNGTITLTSTIDVTQDVALDAGDYSVAISGNNAVRLFKVATNVQFAATNLLLANGAHIGTNGAGTMVQPGEDAAGGAVLNVGGTVSLVSCVLSNNSAVGGNAGPRDFSLFGSASGGAGRGGAIMNLGGVLYLESVQALKNTSKGGSGFSPESLINVAAGPGLGGALYSTRGSVVLSNSIFSSNSSTGLSSVLAGPARGGAIEVDDGSMQIVRSVFVGNGAFGQPGQYNYHLPASAYGGALSIIAGAVVIEESQFAGNQAVGGRAYRYSGTGPAQGGAIHNLGVLTMSNNSISNNQALAGSGSDVNEAGRGGGLYNGGKVSLVGSTFSGNSAHGGDAGSFGSPYASYPGGDAYGGAIYNVGNVTATNCTLALNRAQPGNASFMPPTAAGGAAYGGGIFNESNTAVFMNVTIASNAAVRGANSPTPLGANLANTNGVLALRNSLVAYGLGAPDGWGNITDDGFNIGADGSCAFSSGSSFNFTDPRLGPLAGNGGPTWTMAPEPDSPAVDFGTSEGAPATDQRGVARPFGAGVDMGAVELGREAPLLHVQFAAAGTEVWFRAIAGMRYGLLESGDLRAWEMREWIGLVPTNGLISRSISNDSSRAFLRLEMR